MSRSREMTKKKIIVCLKFVMTTLFFSYLFYKQATFDGEHYPSDLPVHILMCMTETSYSFLYFLLKVVIILFHSYYVIALFEASVVSVTWVLGALLIKRTYHLEDYICEIVSFSLMFLTSIYIPGFYEVFYYGSTITQPWHNITYIFMRPFAILAMYYFSLIFIEYKEGKIKSVGKWLIYSGSLLVATMIKPNFLIGFAAALLIILAVDFFSKKVSFENAFWMGVSVLPAVGALGVQGVILYLKPENYYSKSGLAIKMSPFFFDGGAEAVVKKFLCGLILPFLIIVVNRKTLSRIERFVILFFGVSLLETMFLTETGFREMHGNFIWGLYIAAYFLFLYFIPKFIKGSMDKKSTGKTLKVINITCWLLIAAHLISSICYFGLIYTGGPYIK